MDYVFKYIEHSMMQPNWIRNLKIKFVALYHFDLRELHCSQYGEPQALKSPSTTSRYFWNVIVMKFQLGFVMWVAMNKTDEIKTMNHAEIKSWMLYLENKLNS